VPSHDVLFLGNCYNNERLELVDYLHKLKCDVGIYGECPHTTGNTHYDFAKSRALYEHCKIAVSDVFPGSVGYVSNRLFQAMAAGAFVMQQHSPELAERNGLIPGEHYVEWTSPSDLKRKIEKWLTPTMNEKRKKIARQGQQYVRENFNYDAQVRKLWDLI
jgi:spore maturation protein CgeB